MPPRRQSIDARNENSYAAGHSRNLSPSNTNLSVESRLDDSRPTLHSTNHNSRRMVKRQSQSNVTSVNQANTQKTQNPNRPFFVQDNNPLLHYEGPWTLSGNGFSTTHSTNVSGSSLWLRFNGTAIGLFGTVPQSNATFPPPTVVFKIDSHSPFQTTLPLATMNIPNQPIFATVNPLSVDEHILIINVTAASSPFTVEKFIVFPNFTLFKDMKIGQASASPTSTSTASRSTRTSTVPSPTLQNQGYSTSARSQTSHIAVAAILGTVLFILLGAAIAAYIVWRKHRRQAMKEETFCPAAANARPDTVYTSFTSTESILRNNSSLWSSSFRSPTGRSHLSRSDGRGSNLDMLGPPPLPPKPPLSNSTTKPG